MLVWVHGVFGGGCVCGVMEFTTSVSVAWDWTTCLHPLTGKMTVDLQNKAVCMEAQLQFSLEIDEEEN